MSNPAKPLPLEELKRYFYYDPVVGVLISKEKKGKRLIGDILKGRDQDGYLVLRFNYEKYYVSRICWALYHGRDSIKYIDHADGNKNNNSINNLRECLHHQNMSNKPKRKGTVSSFKGVTKSRNKFKASIVYKGKNIHLGMYDNEVDAHNAYKNKAHELLGEFARTS